MFKQYFSLLLISTHVCFSQIQTFYVKPIQTNSQYAPNEDSSVISINSSNPLNKLFLFIGGTGSSSSKDYPGLRLYVTGLGYHFISICYPDTTSAFSATNDPDSLAYNKFRQELCFGTPLSPYVTIDTLNSIYTRFLNLLNYLKTNYPAQNWAQFLIDSVTINWAKIIVGGHSQGSGHACYLGKYFPVDRVLMFSGPNDYSNYYHNSANWIRQPGVTPATKHFAYLSLNDEVVPFSSQYQVLKGLGLLNPCDTIDVDNLAAPYNNAHGLYTLQTPGIAVLYHNVPIKVSSINTAVWNYMLSTPTTNFINTISNNDNIQIFPNPATDHITITSYYPIGSYSIIDIKGKVIKTGFELSKYSDIDISHLNSGIYFFISTIGKKMIVKN